MAGVTGIVVTRGDVELDPVFSTWPQDWEALSWDNGAGLLTRWFKHDGMDHGEQYEPSWQHDMSVEQESVADLSVYGRYAAIEYASHDIVFVQDDDCIVSDPTEIVEIWWDEHKRLEDSRLANPADWRLHVVCNMPERFRHDFYADHALVGFGAAFHRDAPERAFKRWFDGATLAQQEPPPEFYRTCDVVFTGLTPRVLVDVPKTDREMASDPNRMWKQADHVAERTRMLNLVRAVKNG